MPLRPLSCRSVLLGSLTTTILAVLTILGGAPGALAHTITPTGVEITTNAADKPPKTDSPSTEIRVTKGPPFYPFFAVFPNGTHGFVREFMSAPGAWVMNSVNRFTFWIKVPKNGAALAGKGQHNVQFGTFYKRVANADPQSDTTGGGHDHFLLNIPPWETWTKVILTMHPHQQETTNPDIEVSIVEHPTGESAYNYFDTLTAFTLLPDNPATYPAVYRVGEFAFAREPRTENDAVISAMAGTYDRTTGTFLLTWNRLKTEDTVRHDVRYAFEDIHKIGWSKAKAAPSSSVTPRGKKRDNGMVWQGQITIPDGINTIFFAIKPRNSEVFSQMAIPLVTEVNLPPSVDAGPDQTILFPEGALLQGTVTDDGFPMPPGTTHATWSAVSGPGTVTFEDANAASTTAAFSIAGKYALRLTVTDGALVASDDVAVTVRESKILITTLTSDAVDRDPVADGTQVFDRETLRFSASAKHEDEEDDVRPLSWAWWYQRTAPDGTSDPAVQHSTGQGAIADAVLVIPEDSAGYLYRVTIVVTDGKVEAKQSLKFSVLARPTICVEVPLKQRLAAQDLSRVDIVIRRAADGLVALTTSGPSDSLGNVRIIDLQSTLPLFLGRGVLYDITVTPLGHLPQRITGIGDLFGGCLRTPAPATPGDSDGDGALTLRDLVAAIRHRNGWEDPILREVYRTFDTTNLRDLADNVAASLMTKP